MSNLHGEAELERVRAIQWTRPRDGAGVIEIESGCAEVLISKSPASFVYEARQGVRHCQVHGSKPLHLLLVGHLQGVVGGAAFRHFEGASSYITVDTTESRAAYIGRSAAVDIPGVEPVGGEGGDAVSCGNRAIDRCRSGAARATGGNGRQQGNIF